MGKNDGGDGKTIMVWMILVILVVVIAVAVLWVNLVLVIEGVMTRVVVGLG